MSNPKGTQAETALVRWLRDNGFPGADRIPRKGRLDEGDVGLCPGVMVEVKNRPSKYNPNKTPLEWLEETEVERQNRGAVYGFLVVKPTGVGFTNVGEWHAWLRVDDITSLAISAGAPDVRLAPVPVRVRVVDAVGMLRASGFGDPL